MVLYIFNEHKKIFFKVKKNYDRFLNLFHGLQFSIGEKDPPRNSWSKQETKKGLIYIFIIYIIIYFYY